MGKSPDPRCRDLARHFLGGAASNQLISNLAQAIQDEIESWMKHEKEELERQLDQEREVPTETRQ
jgi:hypothetical protein